VPSPNLELDFFLGEPLTCDILVATALVGLGIFVASFQLKRPATAAVGGRLRG